MGWVSIAGRCRAAGQGAGGADTGRFWGLRVVWSLGELDVEGWGDAAGDGWGGSAGHEGDRGKRRARDSGLLRWSGGAFGRGSRPVRWGKGWKVNRLRGKRLTIPTPKPADSENPGLVIAGRYSVGVRGQLDSVCAVGALFLMGEVFEGGRGDIVQRFGGEEGLMAGDQDIGEGE